MSLPVVLQPEAEDEYAEGVRFLEQRRAGLGAAFAAEVQQVLDCISANPRIHAVVYGNVRKAVIRQYWYSVFYRERADHVDVISVFHSKRNPDIWQARADRTI